MKLEDIAPYLSAMGFGLISIDADDTGADDIAGQFLMYGGDAIFAVQNNLDLPPLPEIAAQVIAALMAGRAIPAAPAGL